MKYTIPQELKSPTKINRWLYVNDLFFVVGYFMILYIFSSMVAEKFQTLYHIFNIVMGIALTLPSPYNPKKRMWQTIVFLIKKDRYVYSPISVKSNTAINSKILKSYFDDTEVTK